MNGKLNSILFFSLLSVSLCSQDVDETLRLDTNPFKNSELFCENERDIRPVKNDFKLIDYHTMSSDAGDRKVLVTVENTSSGSRSLTSRHFIAILGSCEYIRPSNFEQQFQAKEILTLTLDFGNRKFPILKIIN